MVLLREEKGNAEIGEGFLCPLAGAGQVEAQGLQPPREPQQRPGVLRSVSGKAAPPPGGRFNSPSVLARTLALRLAALDPAELDRDRSPDWTLREIAHHVADPWYAEQVGACSAAPGPRTA